MSRTAGAAPRCRRGRSAPRTFASLVVTMLVVVLAGLLWAPPAAAGSALPPAQVRAKQWWVVSLNNDVSADLRLRLSATLLHYVSEFVRQ